MFTQPGHRLGFALVSGSAVAWSTAGLFTRLIAIAALIAFPVAWWAMNKWLQSFAYQVAISWWIFVVAAAAAFLIALITVSFLTIRAAIANPVKSLRNE